MFSRSLRGIFLATALALPMLTCAQESIIPVHVFVREGCTHCADEKAFLQTLASEIDGIEVVLHDLALPQEEELFNTLVTKVKATKSTPLTIINGNVIQGFSTPETTGVRIRAAIQNAQSERVITLEDIATGKAEITLSQKDSTCDESGTTPCTVDTSEYLVNIPFVGAVNLQAYSLPLIAAILGFVDGFNPCAMWVLVTFLLVLLQLKDRRKVWQVAGLFIAAEAIMYYLILNVWFTAWDFIGLDRIVTPIVGIIAIGAGIFFLYEAATSAGQCKVTSAETRRKTHLRISTIATMPFTLATAFAVIGLALSVNIIEFACSVGIPQTFTKILDLNALSFIKRQFLMAIYILMYMVDDFIVFGLALWSTEHMHLTQKYSRISNIVGGILMILLGCILIFAPGWLVIG